MKVRVLGDNPTAAAIRTLLVATGCELVDTDPAVTLTIEERDGQDAIVVDGATGPVLRHTVDHLQLSPKIDVHLQLRSGEVFTDRALRVVLAPIGAHRGAVERAVLYAVRRSSAYLLRAAIGAAIAAPPSFWRQLLTLIGLGR